MISIVGDSSVTDLLKQNKQFDVHSYPGLSLCELLKEPELYLEGLEVANNPLVIVLGTNDLPSDLLQLYATLIEYCCDAGYRKIYLVPPRQMSQDDLDALDYQCEIHSRIHDKCRYRNPTRDESKDNNDEFCVVVLQFFAAISDTGEVCGDTLFVSDGVHFNELGLIKLGEFIREHVQ